MPKPSSGGIPKAIVKRLQSIRYAVGDIAFVIGRFLLAVGRVLLRVPVAIWRGLTRAWGSLAVIARRRLVLALGAAIAALVFFSAIVPNLPCRLPGGDSCAPAEDAAELVPSDALAYLHANLDPDTDEYAAAVELAAKLPVFGAQLAGRALALIPSPGSARLDFDADVRPWFGGEAAIVILPGTGAAPERVDLLEVSDADGAAEYASSIAVGQVDAVDYEGVSVSTDQREVATAQVEGFLVIGTENGVREVVATATGADEAESLADDPVASEVRDQLPEHSFAEAWVSGDGIGDLIAGDTGALGTLTPLIAAGASRGVAASLSADGDELEIAVRSALDPEREDAAPSFFAAFPPFEPQLPQRLAPETLAYLGIGEPGATVSALLSQASEQAPGIAAGFEDLVRSLRREGGVDIEDQLLGALGDEAAFALEPPPGEGGTPTTDATLPYVLFAADGVDEDQARKSLAGLQGPLAELADPRADLQASVFGQQEISGVETNSLRISPTLELSYAVFDGIAAVATDPAGVAGLINDQGGLDETTLYGDATDGFGDQVSLLAYFDLGQLVATAERAGLAEDPLYATFAGDFRSLEAFALAVEQDDESLATDARLLVGEPAPADAGAAPAEPSD